MRSVSHESARSIATFAALATALVALGATLIRGEFTCSGDPLECAETSEKNGFYSGTLMGAGGVLFRDRAFRVAFSSRAGREDVRFDTDEQARYCFVWAKETITPSAVVGDGGPITVAGWKPLHGSAPSGCQQTAASVPWHRAEGLRSSWQFRMLLLIPVLALVALAFGAALGRRRMGNVLVAAGAVLAAGGLTAHLIFWSV